MYYCKMYTKYREPVLLITLNLMCTKLFIFHLSTYNYLCLLKRKPYMLNCNRSIEE